MSFYNNPKIFIANLVMFQYDKEKKEYVSYVLNAKIPVVYVLGHGYYTEPSYIFNNKDSMPLSIMDLDSYKRVNPHKYYLTNVRPLSKYTQDINEFINNINFNMYKINDLINADGAWYRKDEFPLDNGFYDSIRSVPIKLDDDLYVAKLASKIQKFEKIDGKCYMDEYLYISGNFGLFTNDNGIYKSKLSNEEYKALNNNKIQDVLLSFEVDKMAYGLPINNRQNLGLMEVTPLPEFVSNNHLYIEPNEDILKQINDYNHLKVAFKIRNFDDLRDYYFNNNPGVVSSKELDMEIMRRTLSKR